MIQKIKTQIEAINELLAWLKENKPDLYEQRFVQLVQERCRLRKIMEAKRENPAIAAYGESQKGKSYLMGNLLQKDGKPFMITLPTGEKINFVQSINPIGEMKEATGVVTRFTAFSGKNAERYSPQYPVLMKLLSVADMAAIICDGYYNDIRNPRHYSDQEIKELGDSIYERYHSRPEIAGTHLVEDDIFDIKNYIKQYVASKANSLVNGANSGIFDKIALVIRRVPEQEWPDVLKFLWHENTVLTQLFARLVAAMSRLEFAREVYLPIDAVRHFGDNENTIMSVACLNGLDNPDFNKTSDVFLRDGMNYTKVPAFNKAELCAICAEAAYKVDEEYLSTTSEFDPEMLPDETKLKMKDMRVSKDVINVADLLDFPGARNRESIDEEHLGDYDPEQKASNMAKSLLRGKVAYLFNKYCSSRAINILMFCHDHIQFSVTTMPHTLESWINSYVGDTPEKRAETIRSANGIAPLFIVATKFNIDMKLSGNGIDNELNSEAAIDNRWNGRFQTVLFKEIIQAHSKEWFGNWTTRGETFKNTYLLRDYKYSTCSGDGNFLYEGYDEQAPEPREKKLALPQEFYDRLRRSFTGSDIVKKFFADPAKSWDLAATLNNDGALHIIENLRTVAYAMDSIRDNQFLEELRTSANTVYKLMENEYEPEDDSDTLRKQAKQAKEVKREIDGSCERDMYFFGHLIETLQLDPTVAYNTINTFINDTDVSDQPDDPYEILSERCDHFEGCADDKACMSRFMDVNGFDTEDEAIDYLKRHGLKKEVLFNKKTVRLSNSATASTRVYDVWIKQLRSSDLLNRLLTEDDHDKETALTALTTRLADTAERLGLSDHIADAVSEYLDIINVQTAKVDLIADVMTHYINSFVCDLGYSWLTQDQIEAAEAVAQQFNLPVGAYIGKGIEPVPKEEDISAIFTKMMKDNDRKTRTFKQNYFEWIEYMCIAFLNGEARLIKNPEANHALGEILKKLK